MCRSIRRDQGKVTAFRDARLLAREATAAAIVIEADDGKPRVRVVMMAIAVPSGCRD